MLSSKKEYFAGIDAGSRSTKVVLLGRYGQFVSGIRPTGINVGKTAEELLQETLESISAKRQDVKALVGTGYGRVALPFADATLTELSCHAAGAHHNNPDIRLVVDVGGQDSKVLHLDDDGNMVDFIMNDKCAAGTGKFLEMVARTLEIDLETLSEMHFTAGNPCSINSMCVVFVESEIISLLAKNNLPADIVSGVNIAFATRIGNMAKRLGLKDKCVLTGGVAKNRGFTHELTKYLGLSFTHIDVDPQLNGALGAAVLAQRSC